jgi:hypothetical protein
MADFVVELEACQAELDGHGDEGATMIVPARRAPRERRSLRERRAPVMPALLLALTAAAIAAVAFFLFHNGGPNGVLPGTSASKPVKLVGAGSYDPFGDQEEHSELAGDAVDGNPNTAWNTENYRDFVKKGVGLVLRAPSPVALKRMTVLAESGFDVTIQASNFGSTGFTNVSGKQPSSDRMTFGINTHGKDYRYYMVWVTLPRSGGQAHIREVTVRT